MGNTRAEWFLFAAEPLRTKHWKLPAGTKPDDEAAAEAALAAAKAGCGKGSHETSDVVQDMEEGAWALGPALEDEGEDEMAAAWEELAAALGKDQEPPADLPWWVAPTWDLEGHSIGLITPGRAIKLQSKLDETGLRERATKLLAGRGAKPARDWAKLLELLDRAAADDCFLLAVEAMS